MLKRLENVSSLCLGGLTCPIQVDLNVSREVLQQSKTLNAIKSKIVRKAIGMIQTLAQVKRI